MSIEDNFFAKKFQEIEEDISRNLLQFQEIEEELKKLQAKDKMEYDQTSVLTMAEGNI
jgi:hypothetical protein